MTAAVHGALGALALIAIQGTVLAVIALAIARRSRMRPAWQAAVWLVVVARFAVPWTPSLPWSLADLVASLRGAAEPPVVLWSSAPAGAAAPAPTPSPLWIVLAVAWAIGTAIVLARGVLATRRTARAARAAAPAPDDARALIAELAARIGVRTPRLVIGDAAIGPHVVGVIAPIVVVPPALAAGDPAVLRAALLHELAHVRRKDALGRALQLVAVAVFWWLPVVRLAARRLDAAREAACDAWALDAGALSRPAYARLLVEMSRLGGAAAPALAAPHALGARIDGVLAAPVRPRLAWIHKLALVAWVALALGGARSAHGHAARAGACVYTLELAESLGRAHPEADLDGDGVLSHDEACDYQAALARRVATIPDDAAVSTADASTSDLLAEPLCCNREPALGLSTPATPGDATCHAE